LAARRRWNWSSGKSKKPEQAEGWLAGYSPEGGVLSAMVADEWDEERLGNDEPQQGEAA
jgi:hypothetical protein